MVRMEMPDAMELLKRETGLRKSWCASMIVKLSYVYKCRRWAFLLAARSEGGVFFSYTLRELLWRHFQVFGGAYSYGAWACPGLMPPGLVVGRYVSMAQSARVFGRNHPYDRVSMHPFFYNSALGYVERDTIEGSCCWIGHDAWIGDGAILTPGCRRIGIGAVIGAGAIVKKDIPDYAIAGGNPAKVIRYRFEEGIRERLLASHWWERSLEDLVSYLDALKCSVESLDPKHPILNRSHAVLDKRQGRQEKCT